MPSPRAQNAVARLGETWSPPAVDDLVSMLTTQPRKWRALGARSLGALRARVEAMHEGLGYTRGRRTHVALLLDGTRQFYSEAARHEHVHGGAADGGDDGGDDDFMPDDRAAWVMDTASAMPPAGMETGAEMDADEDIDLGSRDQFKLSGGARDRGIARAMPARAMPASPKRGGKGGKAAARAPTTPRAAPATAAEEWEDLRDALEDYAEEAGEPTLGFTLPPAPIADSPVLGTRSLAAPPSRSTRSQRKAGPFYELPPRGAVRATDIVYAEEHAVPSKKSKPARAASPARRRGGKPQPPDGSTAIVAAPAKPPRAGVAPAKDAAPHHQPMAMTGLAPHPHAHGAPDRGAIVLRDVREAAQLAAQARADARAAEIKARTVDKGALAIEDGAAAIPRSLLSGGPRGKDGGKEGGKKGKQAAAAPLALEDAAPLTSMTALERSTTDDAAEAARVAAEAQRAAAIAAEAQRAAAIAAEADAEAKAAAAAEVAAAKAAEKARNAADRAQAVAASQTEKRARAAAEAEARKARHDAARADGLARKAAAAAQRAGDRQENLKDLEAAEAASAKAVRRAEEAAQEAADTGRSFEDVSDVDTRETHNRRELARLEARKAGWCDNGKVDMSNPENVANCDEVVSRIYEGKAVSDWTPVRARAMAEERRAKERKDAQARIATSGNANGGLNFGAQRGIGGTAVQTETTATAHTRAKELGWCDHAAAWYRDLQGSQSCGLVIKTLRSNLNAHVPHANKDVARAMMNARKAGEDDNGVLAAGRAAATAETVKSVSSLKLQARSAGWCFDNQQKGSCKAAMRHLREGKKLPAYSVAAAKALIAAQAQTDRGVLGRVFGAPADDVADGVETDYDEDEPAEEEEWHSAF